MNNYKAMGILLLGASLGLSGTASAEVTEECILTGKVRHVETSTDTVRLQFTRIEHGDQARCRATGRRGGLARLQFEPQPGDALEQLADGSLVRYRYQNRSGEHQWQRLDVSRRLMAQNSRDW